VELRGSQISGGGGDGRAAGAGTHLFAAFGIEQDPTQLNHLGRVFCDIDAVLVAGGGYVDDQIAVQVRGLGALRGHCRRETAAAGRQLGRRVDAEEQ